MSKQPSTPLFVNSNSRLRQRTVLWVMAFQPSKQALTPLSCLTTATDAPTNNRVSLFSVLHGSQPPSSRARHSGPARPGTGDRLSNRLPPNQWPKQRRIVSGAVREKLGRDPEHERAADLGIERRWGGSGRWGLTPVPLSHTTTFLLSIRASLPSSGRSSSSSSPLGLGTCGDLPVSLRFQATVRYGRGQPDKTEETAGGIGRNSSHRRIEARTVSDRSVLLLGVFGLKALEKDQDAQEEGELGFSKNLSNL